LPSNQQEETFPAVGFVMVPDTSPSMKKEAEERNQVAEAAKVICPSDLRAEVADVGAVFAAGSVAGITSELTAARRTVGAVSGGRVAITAAAAAVAVGYGAYCLWKWLSDD